MDEQEWLTTQTAKLIGRAGLDRYVAATIVEPTDQWFPDEWHRDDTSVALLAKRVFEHAELADVTISADLVTSETGHGLSAVELDATHVKLVVDPAHLADPLALIAYLARLAAVVFRIRHALEDADPEQERRLIDLTTIYLGFGLLTTNAAYRYRASGELQGNRAVTRWSHDEQGALPAATMAIALATQLVARDAEAGELRRVVRQLETNQAEVFQTACRQLRSDYVVLALGLPSRSKWPARRSPPPAPTTAWPRLWRKEPNLPVATARSTGLRGHNSGRAVLRLPQTKRGGGGFVGMFAGMVPTIAIAVHGFGGAAMGALAGSWLLGMFVGSRVRYDVCSDPDCGIRLKAGVERCPRCGGHIAGSVLKGENRLEAEERLKLNQDDYDMDVGDASVSGVELPAARIHDGGNTRVDGTTKSTVG